MSCIFGGHKPSAVAFTPAADVNSCGDQEDFATGAASDTSSAAETQVAADVPTSSADVSRGLKRIKPVSPSSADALHSNGPAQPQELAKPTQPGKPPAVAQSHAAAAAAVDSVLQSLLAELTASAPDMPPVKEASLYAREALTALPAVPMMLTVPQFSAHAMATAATQLAIPVVLTVAQSAACEPTEGIPALPSAAAVSVTEACTNKLEVLPAVQAAAEISTASAQLSSPVAGVTVVPAEPDSPATDAAAAQDHSAVQVTLTTTETADAASQLLVQDELAVLQASTAQLAEAVSDPAAMQSASTAVSDVLLAVAPEATAAALHTVSLDSTAADAGAGTAANAEDHTDLASNDLDLVGAADSIAEGAVEADNHHVASSATGASAKTAGFPIGLPAEMTWMEVDSDAGMEQTDDVEVSCHAAAHSAVQHLAATTTGRPRIVDMLPSWKVTLGLSMATPLVVYTGAKLTNLGARLFSFEYQFPT